MLEKLFSNRSNDRNYLQSNTVSQFQAAVLDKYSDTSDARSSRYYLKSHRGSILHMYKVAMQSFLMERSDKATKKRIPED